MRFALIPPPDPYPLSLTLSRCAKPCRASIPTGLCRQQEKMNWAKNPFWRKIIFAQLKIIQGRRSPIQIKCRQAFALLKGVCGSKGLGPRGRGRGRIATPWPLPRVSKPCENGILSEIEIYTLFSRLCYKNDPYQIDALFPSPGKYDVKEIDGNRGHKVCH